MRRLSSDFPRSCFFERTMNATGERLGAASLRRRVNFQLSLGVRMAGRKRGAPCNVGDAVSFPFHSYRGRWKAESFMKVHRVPVVTGFKAKLSGGTDRSPVFLQQLGCIVSPVKTRISFENITRCILTSNLLHLMSFYEGIVLGFYSARQRFGCSSAICPATLLQVSILIPIWCDRLRLDNRCTFIRLRDAKDFRRNNAEFGKRKKRKDKAIKSEIPIISGVEYSTFLRSVVLYSRYDTVSNRRFAWRSANGSSNVHRLFPIRRIPSDIRRPLTSNISPVAITQVVIRPLHFHRLPATVTRELLAQLLQAASRGTAVHFANA